MQLKCRAKLSQSHNSEMCALGNDVHLALLRALIATELQLCCAHEGAQAQLVFFSKTKKFQVLRRQVEIHFSN